MTSSWVPPENVELLYKKVLAGNKFAAINSPIAGVRSNEELPVGNNDIQLYSLSTPNGQKVGILLEELRSAVGLQYDAFVVKINGSQFSKGFVRVNPNSKIPCLVDRSPRDQNGDLRVFESGSIMIYLADKYGKFLPKDIRKRTECINWVMWQMAGQGPMTGACYGHFYAYAPPEVNRDYAVARYGMEVQRLCSVLDQHLADKKYLCGDEYTIADMICMPWFHVLRDKGYMHPQTGQMTRDFLNMAQYKNANRWANMLQERPEVQRGMVVCRKTGKPWLNIDRFKYLARL